MKIIYTSHMKVAKEGSDEKVIIKKKLSIKDKKYNPEDYPLPSIHYPLSIIHVQIPVKIIITIIRI